jgi:Pvc16 N-terminal domain
MSDYLAVGGVTAVLKWLLSDELSASGPSTLLNSGTSVTAVSPDLITAGATEEPQLNLFLYYVSLNTALRNLDLPSRDTAGNTVSSPPLALNLHYLISAYGSTASTQLAAEILLGWAMKVLHDNPVVPPASIAAALSALASAPSPSAEEKLVAASTLAAQIEHLRVTPEALTIEEIYRLWPAFQAPYRPSSAFQVSVVVIQDAEVPAAAPVQTPQVQSVPQVPVA